MALGRTSSRSWLRRWRRQVLAAGAAGLLLGAVGYGVGAAGSSRAFTADVALRVDLSRPLPAVPGSEAAASSGSALEQFRSLLTSGPVLERAAAALAASGALPAPGAVPAAAAVRGWIASRADPRTGTIVVTVRHADQGLVALLVDTLAAVYEGFACDPRVLEEASRQRAEAASRRDRAEADLRAAEAALRGAWPQPLDSLAVARRAAAEQLDSAAAELDLLAAELDAASAALAALSAGDEPSWTVLRRAMQVPAGERCAELAYRLNELRLDREALLVRHMEHDPSVQDVDREMAATTGALAAELQRYVAAVQREVDAARQRRAQARAEHDRLAAALLEVQQRAAAVEARRQALAEVEAGYRQAVEDEERALAGPVTVVARTHRPGRAAADRRPLWWALAGALAGIVAGAGASVAAGLARSRAGAAGRRRAEGPRSAWRRGMADCLLAVCVAGLVWQMTRVDRLAWSEASRGAAAAGREPGAAGHLAAGTEPATQPAPPAPPAPPLPRASGDAAVVASGREEGSGPVSLPDAAPTPAGRSSAAPAGAGPGAGPFAVRVAAYAAGSPWAARWLDSLRAAAYPAFLAPVESGDGGALMRLLVGAYATETAARAVGEGLRQQGLIEGYAVMRLPYALAWPPDAAAGAATAAAPAPLAPYAYEVTDSGGGTRRLVGAFASEKEARAFAARLAVAGTAVVVVRR